MKKKYDSEIVAWKISKVGDKTYELAPVVERTNIETGEQDTIIDNNGKKWPGNIHALAASLLDRYMEDVNGVEVRELINVVKRAEKRVLAALEEVNCEEFEVRV